MDENMKRFQITLMNDREKSLRHHRTVKKIAFPEAVMEAYKLRNKLGFEWRITNVREDISHANTENSKTLDTISLS